MGSVKATCHALIGSSRSSDAGACRYLTSPTWKSEESFLISYYYKYVFM